MLNDYNCYAVGLLDFKLTKEGWLNVEQTLLSNCVGFRAIHLTDSATTYSSINEMRSSPSAVLTCSDCYKN